MPTWPFKEKTSATAYHKLLATIDNAVKKGKSKKTTYIIEEYRKLKTMLKLENTDESNAILENLPYSMFYELLPFILMLLKNEFDLPEQKRTKFNNLMANLAPPYALADDPSFLLKYYAYAYQIIYQAYIAELNEIAEQFMQDLLLISETNPNFSEDMAFSESIGWVNKSEELGPPNHEYAYQKLVYPRVQYFLNQYQNHQQIAENAAVFLLEASIVAGTTNNHQEYNKYQTHFIELLQRYPNNSRIAQYYEMSQPPAK